MSKTQRPIDYAATRRWLATRFVIGTAPDYELPDVLRGDLDADDEIADGRGVAGTEQNLENASWDELFAEFERSQLAMLRQPATPAEQQH